MRADVGIGPYGYILRINQWLLGGGFVGVPFNNYDPTKQQFKEVNKQ